ncbi:HAD family hydrolase [Lactiplantibacillus plajomi]|uniref:HAD family hydrolase n=1 Tax=Lactiplantibacillus plajomi TaxID=1457217 RepID=UPI0010F7F1F6|nr:hypothetical protein [Lactiplantibacillus plajomi]
MSIDLLVVDIDRTNLKSKNEIFQVKGFIYGKTRLAICTASTYHDTKIRLEKLELSRCENTYMICSNGSMTFTTDGRLIDARPLTDNTSKKYAVQVLHEKLGLKKPKIKMVNL